MIDPQIIKLNSIDDLLLDKKRTANVTLTLTQKLQQVATQSLGPRKGAVVTGRVIDRQTGKGVQAGVRFAPLQGGRFRVVP